MRRVLLLLIPMIYWGNAPINSNKEYLSEYELFTELKSLKPTSRVYPYELNTPLFSDYAWKSRFIYLPEGKKISYRDTASFVFPEGSILIKNFYYPTDFRSPEKGKKIIETRLLIKEIKGWKALPYIWNEDQTNARLAITGGVTKVEWKHNNGKKRRIDYVIPNINQCKGCHSVNGSLSPIGPKSRHLNRDGIGAMEGMNQLSFLKENELMDQLPPDPSKNAVWNDPATGNLEMRARSWLDINCAHCHNEEGTASNTGLYLTIHETSAKKLGIFKPPVAAGRASESLLYDIVPGKPHESILLARMITDDVGQRMPEIGRSIKDEEAVALIREWIKSLED